MRKEKKIKQRSKPVEIDLDDKPKKVKEYNAPVLMNPK